MTESIEENEILWGCLNLKEYKLEEPIIIEKRLGFYFISRDEKVINSIYDVTGKILDHIKRTLIIDFTTQYKKVDNTLKDIFNRIINIIIFNQNTFDCAINWKRFTLTLDKSNIDLHIVYISIEDPFPTPEIVIEILNKRFFNEEDK